MRQLLIVVETLALMAGVAYAGAGGIWLYVAAMVGGTVASRYDDGHRRRATPARP